MEVVRRNNEQQAWWAAAPHMERKTPGAVVTQLHQCQAPAVLSVALTLAMQQSPSPSVHQEERRPAPVQPRPRKGGLERRCQKSRLREGSGKDCEVSG